MVVVVAVLVLLVPLLLGLAVARWWAARAVEPDLGLDTDSDADDDAYPGRPLLPAGHRPPPGLSPLSPSERFLAAEASRGLRDLQVFLLDVA